MIVVGRHPQCDARLDSLRVSRHHCCMSQDQGEVIVRDLGSTNGIRINGQRVEFGRLRSGDELSIAHIRYRLDNGQGHEATLADPNPSRLKDHNPEPSGRELQDPNSSPPPDEAIGRVAGVFGGDNPLAAAFRGLLPAGMADRCRIEVIVKMDDKMDDPEASPNPAAAGAGAGAGAGASGSSSAGSGVT
jgi:predicted component of type VI protein secretion system